MIYANPYNSAIELYRPLEEPGVKPGMYEISSIGNIRNVNTGKLLSQAVSYKSGGYRSVGLQMEDGSRKIFPVHRLVANRYIPKTEEDIKLGRDIVNHKNCVTDYNEVANLEWMTFGENIAHGKNAHCNEGVPVYSNDYKAIDNDSDWSNGHMTAGEVNGMSRLDKQTVIAICEELQNGTNPPDIARELLDGTNNDIHIVNDIKRGRRWFNISKDYDFSRQSGNNKDTTGRATY